MDGNTFDQLITALGAAHETLPAQAVRAVNTGLTLRNCLFGFYIETYERGGVDRKQYVPLSAVLFGLPENCGDTVSTICGAAHPRLCGASFFLAHFGISQPHPRNAAPR